MSRFGSEARQFATRLPYTEHDAREVTKMKVKKAGDNLNNNCDDNKVSELLSLLDLDIDLNNPDQKINPKDVALAGWSNWGAGGWEDALERSTLSEDEYILLNDYFEELVKIED